MDRALNLGRDPARLDDFLHESGHFHGLIRQHPLRDEMENGLLEVHQHVHGSWRHERVGRGTLRLVGKPDHQERSCLLCGREFNTACHWIQNTWYWSMTLSFPYLVGEPVSGVRCDSYSVSTSFKNMLAICQLCVVG